MTLSSDDRYAHLRTNAATQKQETVDRLARAIAELEAGGRPVTTFTIKDVSGLDYMAYYRNRQAFQLFQEHSTHLRQKREQEQAKRQATNRGSKRKKARGRETLHAIAVSPRDPLLDYKRPRLVELLHEALAERNQARQQAQAVQESLEQQMQTQSAELEQCYHKLLQEHMQCGLKIARMEAELAEFKGFMERFRSTLSNEEHGKQD